MSTPLASGDTTAGNPTTIPLFRQPTTGQNPRQPTIQSMFAAAVAGRPSGVKRGRESSSGDLEPVHDYDGPGEPQDIHMEDVALANSQVGPSATSPSGPASGGVITTSNIEQTILTKTGAIDLVPGGSTTSLSSPHPLDPEQSSSSTSGRPYKQARLSLASSSVTGNADTGRSFTSTSSAKAILRMGPDGFPTFFLPTTPASTSTRRLSHPYSPSPSSPSSSCSTFDQRKQKQKLLVPHKGRFVLLDREEEIKDLKSGVNVTEVLDGLERELTCMMCSELFIDPVTISPCGHAFCGSCVVKWLKSHKLSSSIAYTNPTQVLTAAIAKIRSRERQAAVQAENYAYGGGGAGGGAGNRRYRTISTGSSTSSIGGDPGAVTAPVVAAPPAWVNGSQEEDDWYALDGRERGRISNPATIKSLFSFPGPTSQASAGQESPHIVPQPTQTTHSAGHKCPFCKVQPVLDAHPNHSLGSLVEVYIQGRPDMIRSQKEVAQARALYQKGDKLSFPMAKQAHADPYAVASGTGTATRAPRDPAVAEARARERELANYFKPCPNCKPLTPAEMLLPDAEKRYVCPIPIPDPADPAHRNNRLPSSGMLPECHIMCSACNALCAEGNAVVCGLCGESACGTRAACQRVVPKLSEGHPGVHEEHEYIDYIWEYDQLNIHNFETYPAMFQHNFVELAYFLTYLQFTYKKTHGLLPQPAPVAPPITLQPGIVAMPLDEQLELGNPFAQVNVLAGNAGAVAAMRAATPLPQLKQWNTSKIIASIGTWLASEEGIAAGGIEGMYRRADPSGMGGPARRVPGTQAELRVCKDCADDVFAQGVHEWWMRMAKNSETLEHLPAAFKNRMECKHGRHCPHQSNLAHCKEYSHLCEKMSAEAFEQADQAAPAAEETESTAALRFREVYQTARITFGLDRSSAVATGMHEDVASEEDPTSDSDEDDVASNPDSVEEELIEEEPAPAVALESEVSLEDVHHEDHIDNEEAIRRSTGVPAASGTASQYVPSYANVAVQTDDRLVQDEPAAVAADDAVEMEGAADRSGSPTHAGLEEDEVEGNLPTDQVDMDALAPPPAAAADAIEPQDAVRGPAAHSGAEDWITFNLIEDLSEGDGGDDRMRMEDVEMEQAPMVAA